MDVDREVSSDRGRGKRPSKFRHGFEAAVRWAADGVAGKGAVADLILAKRAVAPVDARTKSLDQALLEIAKRIARGSPGAGWLVRRFESSAKGVERLPVQSGRLDRYDLNGILIATDLKIDSLLRGLRNRAERQPGKQNPKSSFHFPTPSTSTVSRVRRVT